METQKEIRMKRAKKTLEKINKFRHVDVAFKIKLTNLYSLVRYKEYLYPFMICRYSPAITRGQEQLLKFIQRKPDLFRDIELRIEEALLTNV
jgi:hypothetical protein